MKPALLPPWLSPFSAIVRYAAGVLSVLLAVILVRVIEYYGESSHPEALLYLSIMFSAW